MFFEGFIVFVENGVRETAVRVHFGPQNCSENVTLFQKSYQLRDFLSFLHTFVSSGAFGSHLWLFGAFLGPSGRCGGRGRGLSGVSWASLAFPGVAGASWALLGSPWLSWPLVGSNFSIFAGTFFRSI